MSEFTQDHANVNPSFTATAILPSGANASGPIQGASFLAESGINLSAAAVGTIGNFLATVLAGSGVNASGPVGGTSGDFQSGVLACALISAEASVNVASGVFLSGPVYATSGVFQSGINLSAVIQGTSFVVTSVILVSGAEIAPSVIAVSNIQLSGGAASFMGSLFVQSGLQLSGTLLGSAASFTTVNASTLNVSALLSVPSLNVQSILNVAALISAPSLNVQSALNLSGQEQAASILIACGVNLSGAVQGTTASFTDARTSTLTASGLASLAGGLDVSVLLSVNASATFQSGLNTSGAANVTALSANTSINATSGITASGLLNVQASGTFQSGISTSAYLSVAGNTVLSGNVSMIGAVNTSATLAVGGTVSVNALAVSTVASIIGSSVHTATGYFQSGIVLSGTLFGSAASFTDLRTSTLTASTYASTPHLTVSLLSFADGTAMSTAAAGVSGTWTATQVFQSGFNASASAQGTILSVQDLRTSTATVSATLSVGASGIFVSGLSLSAGFFGTTGSFAGRLIVSTLIQDGTGGASFNASSIFGSQLSTSGAVAVGGTLSANALTVSTTATIVGSTVTGNDLLVSNGIIVVSGAAKIGSGLAVVANVSANASGIFVSGLNTSAGVVLGATLSVLGSLDVASYANFRNSMAVAGQLSVNNAIIVGSITGSTTTIGIFSALGSAAFQSGLNTSGFVTIGASFAACGPTTLGGTTSHLGSAYFQSGVVSSGPNQGFGGRQWIEIPLWTPWGVWTSNSNILSAQILFSQLNGGGSESGFGVWNNANAAIGTTGGNAVNQSFNAHLLHLSAIGSFIANAYLRIAGAVQMQGATTAASGTLYIGMMLNESSYVSGSLLSLIIPSAGQAKSGFVTTISGFGGSLQGISALISIQPGIGAINQFGASSNVWVWVTDMKLYLLLSN